MRLGAGEGPRLPFHQRGRSVKFSDRKLDARAILPGVHPSGPRRPPRLPHSQTLENRPLARPLASMSDFGAVERSFLALRTRKKPRESAKNPRVRACPAPPFTTVALAARGRRKPTCQRTPARPASGGGNAVLIDALGTSGCPPSSLNTRRVPLGLGHRGHGLKTRSRDKRSISARGRPLNRRRRTRTARRSWR